MTTPIDLSGMRFGRLLVTGRAANTPAGQARWNWVCDCGNTGSTRSQDLRNEKTRSCGCFKSDNMSVRFSTHGATRGSAPRAEYTAWANMIRRCSPAADDDDRAIYADRGIVVCEAWVQDFAAFFDHLGPRPSPRHSVDRIDNDGIYEPGNVRWALPDVQANNKRNNQVVVYRGVPLTLHQAWDKSGRVATIAAIRRRLILGWPADAAFDTPALTPSGKRTKGSHHY